MTAHQKIRIPGLGTTVDIAARHIHKHGPATEAELCLVLDFGISEEKREIAMQRAITSGWLRPLPSGKLECGAAAKAHYDSQLGIKEVKVEPIGQIATVREPGNVFARPALSRKNMPNSRGLRQDVPEWSQRPAGFCLKSIGGSEV